MAEHTLTLGIENHLVATFTPADTGFDGAPPVVALLTNSGVIPRSGPHRMNVHLARRFAAQGIPSVRFDMSGLGDSRRTASTLPVVEQWVADTRSVMDAAQARFGCARFLMVGFCSGAEVAHLVALEDPRLRAILIWDLYAYPTPASRARTFLYKLRRAGLAGKRRPTDCSVRSVQKTGMARPARRTGARSRFPWCHRARSSASASRP
jgi:pimeloyl-ACP methyl ester carboxylesterase